MKKITIISVLVLVMCGAAFAQGEKHLSSSPAAFKTFFSKFMGAVKRGDKTQVAGMTRFPFKYGFDAGDEGTMTRTQFVRRFSDVFGKHPRSFMTESNPEFSRDGSSYQISTKDAAHLMFVKRNGTFWFEAYIVEP